MSPKCTPGQGVEQQGCRGLKWIGDFGLLRRVAASWRGLSGCRARIPAGVGRFQQQLAFCHRGMPARMPSRQAGMPTPRGVIRDPDSSPRFSFACCNRGLNILA